jgi:hypothetical protein
MRTAVVNKYHAKRTGCGRAECGLHDSKREAIRCGELQCMKKGRLIRDLKYQPKFDLLACSTRGQFHAVIKIGVYVADWEYHEFSCGAWVHVVEDVKSTATMTPVFRLKQKILRANYGIEIRVTH